MIFSWNFHENNEFQKIYLNGRIYCRTSKEFLKKYHRFFENSLEMLLEFQMFAFCANYIEIPRISMKIIWVQFL